MINKRWVACFTNTVAGVREKLTEACELMIQQRISLLLFCYDLPFEERKIADEICQQLSEFGQLDAQLIFDPTPSDVLQLFMGQANYKTDINLPLIIETFT